MAKFVQVTCIGTKEIKRKDGSGSIFKNYIVYDPIEKDTEGQMCSVLWGDELIPGEVYEKGIAGYNRSGDYTITSIIDD